jgi:hypothetical protein
MNTAPKERKILFQFVRGEMVWTAAEMTGYAIDRASVAVDRLVAQAMQLHRLHHGF